MQAAIIIRRKAGYVDAGCLGQRGCCGLCKGGSVGELLSHVSLLCAALRSFPHQAGWAAKRGSGGAHKGAVQGALKVGHLKTTDPKQGPPPCAVTALWQMHRPPSSTVVEEFLRPKEYSTAYTYYAELIRFRINSLG